jgi:hypothetical protein
MMDGMVSPQWVARNCVHTARYCVAGQALGLEASLTVLATSEFIEQEMMLAALYCT